MSQQILREDEWTALQLGRIRQKIEKLTATSREIRQTIRTSVGSARHAAWCEKAAVGDKARLYFLLYGFLRGVAYRRIEARCHEGNEPQHYRLVAAFGRIAGERPDDAFRARLRAWLKDTPATHGQPVGESLQSKEAAMT